QLARRRDRTDGRQVIITEWRVQDRRLPTRRVCAHDRGQQIKTSLIYPDECASFSLGFFLIAGHFCSRQAAIACSLRWVARSIGFCTLQPTSRSRRPTWSGWYATPNSCLITAPTPPPARIPPPTPQPSPPL